MSLPPEIEALIGSLRAEIEALRAENTALRAENAEFKRRLGLDSSNSSNRPRATG
jgi:transposase